MVYTVHVQYILRHPLLFREHDHMKLLYDVPRGSKVAGSLFRSNVLARTVHSTKTSILPMTPKERLD